MCTGQFVSAGDMLSVNVWHVKSDCSGNIQHFQDLFVLQHFEINVHEAASSLIRYKTLFDRP